MLLVWQRTGKKGQQRFFILTLTTS